MKQFRVQLLGAALVAVASASSAPASAQAPAPTGFTGPYVTLGAGYGGWTADTTTVNPATGQCDLCVPQTQGGAGLFGTLGIGYDHQFGPHFVAGIFADADIGHIEGTIQDQGPYFAGRISQSNAIYLGARAGWVLGGTVMPFVDVGYSRATFSGTNMVFTWGPNISPNQTSSFGRNGWFVGAGVEGQIAPGWFLRGEYRRADYGTTQIADNGGPLTLDNISFHPVTQTFRANIVYKFSSAGAQPATPEPAPDGKNPFAGLHIAIGGGYGMWSADTTTIPAVGFGCRLCVVQTQGGSGGLARFAVGYDYPVMPNLIVGVFADVDLSAIQGTIQDQDPFFAGHTTQDRSFSFGGRVGWVATPSFMPYGTFGFTQTHFTSASMVDTFAGAPSGFSTPAFSRSGYFAGVGAEARIMDNWAMRGEYRYSAFGRTTLADTMAMAGPAPLASITFRPTTQTFVVSAIYRFNFLNR